MPPEPSARSNRRRANNLVDTVPPTDELRSTESSPADEAPSRRREHPWLLVTVLAVVLAGTVGGVLVFQKRSNDDAQAQLAARQAEILQRGAQVMPFDQNTTTHQFHGTDTGGIQTVTVNDPNDATNIALIQSHLRQEADAFAAGDYGDPAAIHGQNMPGLAALQAGAKDVTVRYESLPDGARITFTTSNPTLIDALHAWFDAQLSDHGPRATP